MPVRMPRIRFTRRVGRVVLGIVGFILILFALAAWQVPEFTRRALTQDVAGMLGRDVTVGKITFNPFTLTLRAHDIAVQQPGGAAPLLAVAETDISVAWRSLFWFAPVVDSLVLRQPQVALVRDGPTQFNFSDVQKKVADLAAAQPPAAPKKDDALPRFSLNNMVLENGSVTLDDHVTGRKQVVDEIGLGIPFISTFGYAADIDVLPRFHARINGSPFDLHGTARPFDTVPTSALDVVFSDLALEQWADAWPAPLPFKLARGLLDSDMHIVFEQPKDATPTLRIAGSLRVHQFDLRETSGDSLLGWRTLDVRDIELLPLDRKLHVGDVELLDPQVQTRRYADQRVNWLDIIGKLQQLGGGQAAATPAPAGQQAPASAAPADAEPSPWQVAVDGINIGNGLLHLRDANTQLDYTLSRLAVALQHIQLPQPKDQPIGIWLTADNADGGQIRAMGPLMLQPLSLDMDLRAANLPLAPFAGAVHGAAPVTLLGGVAGVSAQIKVAQHDGVNDIGATDVKVDLADLSVRDEAVKPPITTGLKNMTLTVDRLALGPGTSAFNLQVSGVQGNGAVATQGTFSVQPLAVKAKVDLSNLNLAEFAPYAASSLNATVRSVTVGAKGDAEFAAANGAAPMTAAWNGAVAVTDLNLQDRVNKADFLSWKRLALDGMAVSVAGGKPTINLGDVTLEGFYGNVLLNPQGRLNVMDLVAEPGKAGGSITQDTQTRAPTPAEPAGGGAMPDISVKSVTLKDGRATFNDRFVRPNYTAELSSIAGSVSAVSSTKPQPAKVGLTGRVYRTAPLSISGVVQPFGKFLALDIKASAKGVDLPRFTTYSAKYVGYPIKRGKLSVDLEYRIKNRELQASNRVQLNQLTFGDKTNSPDATTLPVMLAVALLKDRNGNIDIDLPISGSLDDPSFSVGGIIVRVVVNLVVKAVTSPFSLLASAFGGGEELAYVEFKPGSAALDDQARDRLGKLTTALNDRPSLKMDISGRADPATDTDGLRQAWVDARIRAAWARAAGKNAKADGPMSAADHAKYLEAAYDGTKMESKPRNFIGMSKSLPADQMEALMRQAAPVGEEQLRQLADARAQAVYEQLQTHGGPANRIFTVAPALSAEGIKDDGPPNRVDFSLK